MCARVLCVVALVAGLGFESAAQLVYSKTIRGVNVEASVTERLPNGDAGDLIEDSDSRERFITGQDDGLFDAVVSQGGGSAMAQVAFISNIDETGIELKADLSTSVTLGSAADAGAGGGITLGTSFTTTSRVSAAIAGSIKSSNIPNDPTAGIVQLSVSVQGFAGTGPDGFINLSYMVQSFPTPTADNEVEFFEVINLEPGGMYFVSISAVSVQMVDEDGPTSVLPFDAEVNFTFDVEDADGDGLFDRWETEGIDTDADDVVELDLPGMGADPMRKDIFVEIDARSGATFPQSELAKVRTAFANAPVSNPDGSQGITLHTIIDETNLPSTVYPASAAAIKPVILQTRNSFFGTPADRSAMNSEGRIKAREQSFRYCIWGGTIANGASGWGELPGDDFIVTLDNFNLATDDAARTFMHELGHNLGLRHGGGDDVNDKPNYISVMNYTYQMVVQERGPEFNDAMFIDYSRAALPALNEDSLDESVGVGASGPFFADKWIAFSTTNGDILVDEAVGSTNFDDDNNFTETGVMVDLNNYGSGASPGETLTSHDDWAALQLPVRDGANFGSGNVGEGETTSQTGQLTLALLQQYRSLNYVNISDDDGECLADVNQDGEVNGLDFGAWLGAFNAMDPRADQNEDGAINGLDFGAWLGNFNAGCS